MQNYLLVEVMELVVISLLCVSLFALQEPCASLQIPQLQWSSDGKENSAADQPSVPTTMPRKLRFVERVTVQGHEAQDDTMTQKTQTPADISGKKAYQKEQVVYGSRGTRQEWSEWTDNSEYFTMDYTHVRRRRPIHNKSLPVAP